MMMTNALVEETTKCFWLKNRTWLQNKYRDICLEAERFPADTDAATYTKTFTMNDSRKSNIFVYIGWEQGALSSSCCVVDLEWQ